MREKAHYPKEGDPLGEQMLSLDLVVVQVLFAH